MLNATGQSSSQSLQLVVNEYSQDTTPFRLMSSSSLVRLTSPTLNIQILDNSGSPISPQTQLPVNFIIKRSQNLIEASPNDAKVEECRFWDVLKQNWRKQGCIVSSPPGSSQLNCTCYHLTAFSGVNVKNPSTWIASPADLQSALRFDINMDITLIPTTTIILLVAMYGSMRRGGIMVVFGAASFIKPEFMPSYHNSQAASRAAGAVGRERWLRLKNAEFIQEKLC